MLEEIKVNCAYGIEREKTFNFRCRVVSASFIQQIDVLELGEFKQLHITLYFEGYPNVEYLFNDHYKHFLGIRRNFNFIDFWLHSKDEQKLIIAKLISDMLVSVKNKFNYQQVSIETIQGVYDKTISNDFDWSGYLSKKTLTKKRNNDHCYKLFYRYDDLSEKQVLYLHKINNDGKLQKKIRIVSLWPFKDYLNEVTNKVKWLNEYELLLTPRSFHGFKIIVNIRNNDVIIEGELPKWASFTLSVEDNEYES